MTQNVFPLTLPVARRGLMPSGRFGARAVAGLDRATLAVDRTLGWAQADRTREMLLLDFVGFGLLRTGFDLFRGAFFGQPDALNIPAARERLIREAGSIFTDNIVSGLAAFGLGWWLDRRHQAISNRFMDFRTLELMRDITRDHNDPASATQGLARLIAGDQTHVSDAIARHLDPNASQPAAHAAEAIAQVLGKREFDVSLQGKPFRLDDLVEDWRAIQQHPRVAQASRADWRSQTQGLIARTLRNKHFKLGALAKGFSLTIAVTLFNNWLTRHLDNIPFYPGEIGLRKHPSLDASARTPGRSTLASPVPVLQDGPFNALRRECDALREATIRREQNSLTPYVSSQWRQGQPMPLLLGLAPLGLAVGLFDTVTRRWNNPFRPGFAKKLRDLYDFGKGFPYTTQQQMASLFAALISARLLISRSDNEYRERLVDSGLGWAFWILGTPIIKRLAARWLDRTHGTHLLKSVDGRLELRTRAEIDRLLRHSVSSAAYRNTLQKHIWLGAVSNLVTLVLLGVAEPLIAIQWTKRRGVSASSG